MKKVTKAVGSRAFTAKPMSSKVGKPAQSVSKKTEVEMPKFKEGSMHELKDVAIDDTFCLTKSLPLPQLLSTVLDDPEAWLSMPSAQLGGRKPADLIGTEEEQKIVDLLLAVDQGLF